MRWRLPIISVGLTLAFIFPAFSANPPPPPRFDPPLDCLASAECFIQKYVDHDLGPGVRDYQCGPLSSNGHKGTDFRLATFEMMERGVVVQAGADGTVIALRDGMPDVHSRLVGRDAVVARGLGNAVVLDHGGGWRSTYGHLRRGSLSVAKGQHVKRGDSLGLVGLSGLTEFPHVHFQVTRNNVPIDPFTGKAQGRTSPGDNTQGSDNCRATVGGGLWRDEARDALAYQPTFLLHAGFSDKPMRRAALQYGLYNQTSLPKTATSLLFGVLFSGARKGDTYRLRLLDPAGAIFFDTSKNFPKNSPVRFIFGGKTNKTTPWRKGLYRAIFDIRSAGKPILTVRRSLQLR